MYNTCIKCIKCPNHSSNPVPTPEETMVSIPPNPCQINQNECIICRDETKSMHQCPQCTKGGWRICQQCRQTLHNQPCPVCRHVTTDQVVIAIGRGRTSDGPRRASRRARRQFCRRCQSMPDIPSEYREKIIDILQFLYYLILMGMVFIACQYLGKFYYWAYCTGTCDEKSNNCSCGKQAKRDGYWSDFHYCILEALGGMFVTLLFISCCCIKK